MGNCFRVAEIIDEDLLRDNEAFQSESENSSSDEAPLFSRLFRSRRSRNVEREDNHIYNEPLHSRFANLPPMTDESLVVQAQRRGLIQHLPLTTWKIKPVDSRSTTELREENNKTPPPPCYEKSLEIFKNANEKSSQQKTSSTPTTSKSSRKDTCSESDIKLDEKDTAETECTICMDEFKNGDHVRYLPCMHFYHQICIDDWLLRSFTCPRCMENVDVAIMASFAQQLS